MKENEKPDKGNQIIEEAAQAEYKYGFVTDIETEVIPKGLDEDVVRRISALKGEPEWLLDFRLKAYRHWLTLKAPTWGHVHVPEIDYQDISYYAAPRHNKQGEAKEIDPELKKTFDKLGIPLEEQMRLSGMAVDAVMDSVSVKTTYRERLAELGVIFCSISEAVKDYPDLVRNGHVYILQTPLFRVRNKKETYYCYSDEERLQAIQGLGPDPEITRFKGLGEISPDEFAGFIGPDIRLEQVTLHKGDEVEKLLAYYMGKNTMERQNFIIDNLVIEEDIPEEEEIYD